MYILEFWGAGKLSVVCWVAIRDNTGSEPGFQTPSAFDRWLSLFGIRFNSTGERGCEASIKYAELWSLEIPLLMLLSLYFQEDNTAGFLSSADLAKSLSAAGDGYKGCTVKSLLEFPKLGHSFHDVTYLSAIWVFSNVEKPKIWMLLPYVCCFNQNNLIINFLDFLQCSWANQKLLLHCCVLLLVITYVILRC